MNAAGHLCVPLSASSAAKDKPSDERSYRGRQLKTGPSRIIYGHCFTSLPHLCCRPCPPQGNEVVYTTRIFVSTFNLCVFDPTLTCLPRLANSCRWCGRAPSPEHSRRFSPIACLSPPPACLATSMSVAAPPADRCRSMFAVFDEPTGPAARPRGTEAPAAPCQLAPLR